MKPGLPSPAMVVAVAALIVALSGTAVAAVDFARNAGAVDGKSAVADGASLKAAAGRLVATRRSGAARGTIAAKYLDLRGVARGSSATFGRSLAVLDNQTLAPLQIGTVPGLGTLTATCADENGTVGRLDPATTITFANTSGEAVNLARNIGYVGGTNVVTALPNGATHALRIAGSSPFALHLERRGTNYLVDGVVRQDGRNAPGASCLFYGVTLTIPPS